jgi:hypothetical protein
VSEGSVGGTVSGSQFTVTDSGAYEIHLNVVTDIVASGNMVVTINKNGSPIASQAASTAINAYTPISISSIFSLVASDVIDCRYTRFVGAATYTGGLSNFLTIRRLQNGTIATTFQIVPGTPINRGSLGYAPFNNVVSYGNDGVTVSTTASPVTSNTVGRVTFNVEAVYHVRVQANVLPTSGNYIEFSAVFIPRWDNYHTTTKQQLQSINIDYIGVFNKSQMLNVYASEAPSPTPSYGFGGSLQTLAYVVKIGNTYTETCNGIITLTDDNCETYMHSLFQSTADQNRYEISIVNLDVDCENNGLSGIPTDGRAFFRLQLVPATNLNTPTPSPQLYQFLYIFGCRYINDQNAPTYTPTPYTSTPTPFTTFSQTASRYSIDLANQVNVDCRPYNAAISFFSLRYNSGTARISYDFRCTPFKIPGGMSLGCITYYTDWQDNGSGYALVFMDRVGFTCPLTNQVVAWFKLETSGGVQRYLYVCCRVT